MSYRVINDATGETAAVFDTNSVNRQLAIQLAENLAKDPGGVWTVIEVIHVAGESDGGDDDPE